MASIHTIIAYINRQLASVKFTVFLLIILSIVCILGTVVPQNAPPEQYLALYSATTYSLLERTGVTDLFNSWWFRALLIAFIANLVACTMGRTGDIQRIFRKSDPVLDENRAKQLPCFKTFTSAPIDRQQTEGVLAGAVTHPRMVEKDNALHFFSEKGRMSHSAFLLIHLGLILVAVGALLGTTGFDGHMRIYEGESSNEVTLRKTDETLLLNFHVRCDRFEVRFYEGYNMPKAFESTLTVIENDDEVLTRVINVNHPLDYKGIRFYQSSYGTARRRGETLLKIIPADSENSIIERVPVGGSLPIPGTEDAVSVSHMIPDFARNSDGEIFSRSEEFNNPAVRVTVTKQGEPVYASWVFARFPDIHKHPDQPYDFQFLNFFPIYYTGLQVATSPGIWFVWTGCIVLVIGTLFSFFISHKRVWLCIRKEADGRCTGFLAGTANRNRRSFVSEFNNIYTNLSSMTKEG